jgi:hypothetical protein
MNETTSNSTQTILSILFATLFFLPVLASAQIVSETSADSDSGGNSAGSGGTTTTGDSSASARTTTVIDGGSGVVDIQVKTETNGEVHTETIKKEIKAGEEVHISTTSSTKGATAKPKTEAKAKANVEASVTIGKTVQSNVTSSTFWSRIPLWKPFVQISSTTSEFGKPDKAFIRIHATSSPVDGLKSFIQRIFGIVIFWR